MPKPILTPRRSLLESLSDGPKTRQELSDAFPSDWERIAGNIGPAVAEKLVVRSTEDGKPLYAMTEKGRKRLAELRAASPAPEVEPKMKVEPPTTVVLEMPVVETQEERVLTEESPVVERPLGDTPLAKHATRAVELAVKNFNARSEAEESLTQKTDEVLRLTLEMERMGRASDAVLTERDAEISRLKIQLQSMENERNALRESTKARSPSYDGLLLVVQVIGEALGKAGIVDCDNPGDAIENLAKQRDDLAAEVTRMKQEIANADAMVEHATKAVEDTGEQNAALRQELQRIASMKAQEVPAANHYFILSPDSRKLDSGYWSFIGRNSNTLEDAKEQAENALANDAGPVFVAAIVGKAQAVRRIEWDTPAAA